MKISVLLGALTIGNLNAFGFHTIKQTHGYGEHFFLFLLFIIFFFFFFFIIYYFFFQALLRSVRSVF